MLDNARIKIYAEKAAYISHTVLGLECPYAIALINDPTLTVDGQLDTKENVIQLNLAKLKPFATDVIVRQSEEMSEEYRRLDEDYRHMLKVCFVVFHEMRHLYQKMAVQAYTTNKMLGGRLAPQPESDKKCEMWLKEMQSNVMGDDKQDIETDANDFAYYLSNRYPIRLPMLRTSRRLGAFKRKYDKVEIPKV